ncbi:polyphosphate polymerase domain-containing protein [Marinilactibacillus psychrotolerans]|uniref:Molecular chaperone n=1 Tax=Marinilactibacillus psychrotolerans TaxID=191770 RepID=A0AAV3WTV7_9LACT|nr:polyphosphate polymerase domain-containing protein [Marinilactibacillus psychrotolerans]GEL66594.1 molecular chaperone [Marinilactibacillus psychrotolerans]GEQ35116.1 molecular chaperone [Marinilactibacillus psychrotolerans]SDC82168.1 VTC domain-containing protein [Marinilactibacillus psychrotolerans]
MEEKFYRHEYKHEISELSKQILMKRLRKLLPHDEHVIGTHYHISSLYFDNIEDEAYYDNQDGNAIREKFRIRYYNQNLNFIRLEKKVKEYNAGYKLSTMLTKGEAKKMIQGDLFFLKDSNDPLKQDFYVNARTKLLKPKVIVAYDREAFAYKMGNTRVTLDYNMKASNRVHDFLETEAVMQRESDVACVLEVKYDTYLPGWIRELVQIAETTSCGHSKYMISRVLTT